MVEFTGERIVPGLVDDDLFHEHVSRYEFAATFSKGKSCLDAGCGLGYGAARLARAAASVVALDIDLETVVTASKEHRAPALSFGVADVGQLPFPDHRFDLAVSFEVVEHLPEWREFLSELSRVTKPSGLAIISTPNIDYYATSRGESGPNPFHIHEFNYNEFAEALRTHFAHFCLLGQNTVPANYISPDHAGSAATSYCDPGGQHVADAQFYVAVCSQAPLAEINGFAFLASRGNVLLERARHIQLLQDELGAKTQWLREATASLQQLQHAHSALDNELKERSAWAIATTAELETKNQHLASELATKCAELAEAVQTLHDAELTIRERTEWAKSLDAHNGILSERISQLEQTLEKASSNLASSFSRITELEGEIAALHAALANHEAVRTEQFHQIAGLLGIHLLPGEPTSTAINQRIRELLATLENQRAVSEQQGALLAFVRASRWLRLGRRLGVGPNLDDLP